MTNFRKHLSPLAVWGLAFGYAVGWGAFVMPGAKFLPDAGPLGTVLGVVLGALLKAIDAENLAKDDVAIISGIGCSSRASGYVDFNTANTLHGRALPISTGLKMARPELHVITLSGDGDCSAIGGNHLIHAARRNIGLTLVVFAYAVCILGMWGMFYPWRIRQAMAWMAGEAKRVRAAGAAMASVGALFAVLGACAAAGAIK